MCGKTQPVSPSLHDEEIDWIRCRRALLGVFPNSVPDVLRPGRLHVSLRKSVLCFCHGAEFHFRSLYGIGVYNISLYHHVVPVLSYLYFSVQRAVFPQESNSNAENQQRTAHVQEVKVTKTLAAVLVGFSFCWFPIMIIDQIDMNNGAPTLPRQVYYFYGLSIYMSSAINPVLYGLLNRSFCAEYKRTITCKTA